MTNTVISSRGTTRVRHLTGPQARPGQPARNGRSMRPAGSVSRGRVAACDVPRPRRPWWVRVKMAVFALLTTLSFAVATPHLLAMTQPDPAVDPVAGDPAWAHVFND